MNRALFFLGALCFVLLSIALSTSAQVSTCTSCQGTGCTLNSISGTKCRGIGGTFAINFNSATGRNETCCSNVPTPFTFSWVEKATSCSALRTVKLVSLCSGLGGTQTCATTSTGVKVTCSREKISSSRSPISASGAGSPSRAASPSIKASASLKASVTSKVSPSTAASVTAAASVSKAPTAAATVSKAPTAAASVSKAPTAAATSGKSSAAFSPSHGASPVSSSTGKVSGCINCSIKGCFNTIHFQKKCAAISGTYAVTNTSSPRQLCCNTASTPFTFAWTEASPCSALRQVKLVKLCTALSGTQTCTATSVNTRVTCTHA